MALTFTFNPVSGNLDVTVKPATTAETNAGTSTQVYISPQTLAAYVAAQLAANAPASAKLFNYYNYI
jgi:hypothetical protein